MTTFTLTMDARPGGDLGFDSTSIMHSKIILFFLNGKTSLGAQLLRSHKYHKKPMLAAWPNMIGTLGFTTKEGDIREGYCDRHETDDQSCTTVRWAS